MSSMKEGSDVDNQQALERNNTTTLALKQEENLVALIEDIEPKCLEQIKGKQEDILVAKLSHEGGGSDTAQPSHLGADGGSHQQLLTHPSASCCCQQPSCPAFQRTQTLKAQVVELESKNDLAGRYGQTLLQRHESLVASFTQERKSLMMQIEGLTQANADLESKNRATLLENRQLVEHLEGLNSSIGGKDDRISTLTLDLRRTEEELARIGRMSGRAIPELERQLERLEEDLMDAQRREETVGEEGRVAALRWQQSERTIGFLQEQLERIEKEAKEERERHADVLERVQRRRTVEAELAAKNGRQWKSTQSGLQPGIRGNDEETTTDGNGVVSNFVTDLLQDNANLQVGIVELRDMLHRSNEEIERLREQLLLQAPELTDRSDMPALLPPVPATSLNAELSGNGPAKEIHVHHHYHAPNRGSGETRPSRSTSSRRRSKKRDSVSSHAARGSISGIKSPPPGFSASVPRTMTGNPSKRWSTQSNQTVFTSASSLPSSPYDSVFDKIYGETTDGDISRPSTPDSLELSPRMDAAANFDVGFRTDSTVNRRKDSVDSILLSPTDSIPGLVNPESTMSAKAAGKQPLRETSYQDPSHSIILEENEDPDSTHTTPDAKMRAKIRESPAGITSMPPPSTSPTRPPIYRAAVPAANIGVSSTPSFMAELNRPSLRRHASHESLISVGGMDIHTLQTRPSQLLLGKYIAPSTALSVATTSTASAMTAQSVAGVTTEYAQSHRGSAGIGPDASFSSARSTSATYLSGIIAGRQGGGVVRSSGGRKSLPTTNPNGNTGLGGRMGGWSVFGRKWGLAAEAPVASSTSTTTNTAATALAAAVTKTPTPLTIDVEDQTALSPSPSLGTLPIPSASSPIRRPSTASSSSTATRSNLSGPGSVLIGSPSGQPRSKKPVPQLRGFGVNQSGPIFGFGPEKKLEPVVRMSGLDVDALRESLEDH